MAGFEDFQSKAATDFSPGAQVPLTGSGGQTAATQALSSAAYRDGRMEDLQKASEDVKVKKGKLSLFEPNLGEAWTTAVRARMLGGARKAVIQSFGLEPQTVVEHCLAAARIRKDRDIRLTLIMVVCGLLFLPGVLLWLGGFQLRRWTQGTDDKQKSAMGVAAMVVLGALGVGLLVRLPLDTFWGYYVRGMLVLPIVGWWWAKQVCEKTHQLLHDQWSAVLGGGGSAVVPEAVPQDPGDSEAEGIRLGLAKLAGEQASNLVFYAGPKGILGMGTRWGSWQLAEELVPLPGQEIDPFRSWDVARAIHDQLKLLDRKPIHTGGFPKPSVQHWVVSPISEGAGSVSRPSGQEVDGYRIKDIELQRICNEQQFGAGNRHNVGVQFVLWDGQLVLTMMISVTVLHHTLRIEVTGHALGPVSGVFFSKPSGRSKTVSKSVRFWETKSIKLPLVEPAEVVRLAARAPLTWFPPVLEFLGGGISLPEPFGLRHVWADKPWRHRFMADDALRAMTPVMRVVHQAAIKVLAEHRCDTSKFGARAASLSGAVQDPSPKKADEYGA